MHGRLGVSHERVDIAFRLNDRAHVMMIAELEPLVGQALGELVSFAPYSDPIVFVQTQALG